MTCGCNTPAPAGAGRAGAGGGGGASISLRVLGAAMAPALNQGDIIIVEPDGALRDGSFVLAQLRSEWIFRQLARRGEGWCLRALNPARADLVELSLPDLSAVHGVIIQKAVPGRRKLTRHYI